MDTSENESGSRKDSTPGTSVKQDRWIDISFTWPLYFTASLHLFAPL